MGGDALQLGRSGVALATRRRHLWFSTYGLKAFEREVSIRLRCFVEYGKLYLYLYLHGQLADMNDLQLKVSDAVGRRSKWRDGDAGKPARQDVLC